MELEVLEKIIKLQDKLAFQKTMRDAIKSQLQEVNLEIAELEEAINDLIVNNVPTCRKENTHGIL